MDKDAPKAEKAETPIAVPKSAPPVLPPAPKMQEIRKSQDSGELLKRGD